MSYCNKSSHMTSLNIRPVTPEDVQVLFNLIKALAEYEQLGDQVVGNPSKLKKHLFGEKPCIEAVLAEWSGETAGFALFFPNYSTFLTQPGLYLEDLFVLPEYRRRGIAKAIFIYLAKLALQRGNGRFEWSVLDWNKPAIAFYEKMGAEILSEWRTCRISGEALLELSSK